jgi:uncharacterized membrane protein
VIWSKKQNPISLHERLGFIFQERSDQTMSKGARSLFIFSLYLYVLGAILLIFPNVLLRMFFLPATDEVWIRVVGMLVFILGFYYFQVARNELRKFIQWTVYARISVLFFFIAFVIAGLASPLLILFGVIDVAAAIWTQLSLRSDKTTAAATA